MVKSNPTIVLQRCDVGTLRPGDWVCWPNDDDGCSVGYAEYIELVRGEAWVWARSITTNFPPPNDWTDTPHVNLPYGIRADRVWAIKKGKEDE